MNCYEKKGLSSEIYSSGKLSIHSYFKSVKYYLTAEYFKDGYSFLDIGGASGELAKSIQNDVADIKPTIIEPNKNSIIIGKKTFKDIEFIEDYFPSDKLNNRKFDIVSMQALFPLFPNWKEILLKMRQHANKYINLSLVFKLNGTTVIDKDVSYGFYLETGERIHQIVHNIYEFMNFCFLPEMGVKKVNFYGYHTPFAGDNFRCVPNSEQIRGNIMLELFEKEEDNPKRCGGGAGQVNDNMEYKFFIPELNIIIDDKEFNLRE